MQVHIGDRAFPGGNSLCSEMLAHRFDVACDKGDMIESASANVIGHRSIAEIGQQSGRIVRINADDMHNSNAIVVVPRSGKRKLRTGAFAKTHHIVIEPPRRLKVFCTDRVMIQFADRHRDLHKNTAAPARFVRIMGSHSFRFIYDQAAACESLKFRSLEPQI